MENKKLLGQFNRNVGFKYQGLLEEARITVHVEDWSNSLELTTGTALVRLFVTKQNYDRALNLIKDFENETTKRLTESGDKAVGLELFKTILGIIVRVAIILGIIIAFFFSIKYYNIYTAMKFEREGIAEYIRGNFTQGVADFTKVIEIYSRDANAYFDRGLAYNKSGNFTYAIADFYKVIEFYPNDYKAYDSLGLSFYHLGNFNKAIEFCTKAIEINPRDGKAWVNRGLVYDKLKNYNQAVTDFTQATILDSKNTIAFNDLGYTYAEQGNLSQAFNYINRALQIDPQNKYAYFSRGYAYFKNKEYDKAWADIHKAEALGNKPEKEDLEFLEKLKQASGRDK